MSPRQRLAAVLAGEALSTEGRIHLLRHLRDKANKRRQRYEDRGKRWEAEIEEHYISRLDAEILRLKEDG